MNAFISCSCLIALARTSRTLLSKSGESGHLCLVCDFRRKAFSFSPLSILLAESLSYVTCIMLGYFPFIHILLSVLIVNACYFFSHVFFCSIDKVILFLIIILLTWCITLINLHMVSHPCAPGVNPTRL